MADPLRDPEWHFDVVEASSLHGDSNGGAGAAVGARYRWVFDYMGQNREEAVAEIKAFEPDQRMEMLAVAGPLVQTISYRFEPQGEDECMGP